MWTIENRARYDRSKLRYPSDLTDEEWSHVEPLIRPGKRGGNSARERSRGGERADVHPQHRLPVAGYPQDLPPRSTVYDSFELWNSNGTLDRIMTRST